MKRASALFEILQCAAENPDVSFEERDASILSLTSGEYLSDFEAV